MRQDAVRALRVDDELPTWAELEAIGGGDLPAIPTHAPRNAPGRAYGSRRRGESTATGYQPARRTVEITGQAPAPRRRSHTQTAFAAHPDRAALWAFFLALFLVVMALVTAHG